MWDGRKINISLIDEQEEKIYFAEGATKNLLDEIGEKSFLLYFCNSFSEDEFQKVIKNVFSTYTETKNVSKKQMYDIYEQLSNFYGEGVTRLLLMDAVNYFLKNKKNKDEILKQFQETIYCANVISKMLLNKIYKNTIKTETASVLSSEEISDFIFDEMGNCGGDILYSMRIGWKDSKMSFYYVYTMTTLLSVLMFEFGRMLRKKVEVKKCENCGKFFIPSVRSDEIYCDYEFKNGKTCKQVGYEIKLNNDEFLKAYRTAYKTQHAKMQRNKKNKPDYKEKVFDVWVKYAKENLNQAKNGDITLEEFKKFINVK